ncbi:MAG: DUF3137 domain-containing protein [Clostridia bacterium]|nr:DUF3137 domain-containing protein [bacterium]MBR4110261.1 DUF3137 domain-containing protein [Clostridia bacterium]
MKKIEKIFKIIKKGEYWPIVIIFAMCIFSVIFALLGFSENVILIFVLFALAVFIFKVFHWSFKKLNEEKNIYNTSKLKKITEYENIYHNFYKKYKYFFDRNAESEKKEGKISVITVIKAISSVIAIACLIFFENPFMMRCGLLFGAIAGITIFIDRKKAINQPVFVQKQAIQDLIKLINNTFVFSDEKQENIKQQYYKVASLAGENVANYYSENHIYGYLDDKKEIYMEMAEAISTEKVDYPKDDEIIFFKGVFLVANINKKIYNTINITPNTYFYNTHNVKMDNTEFEKYFDIKCEDKVLVMRIFTAEVIDKLCNLYNKCNIQYEIIVDNNKIYLRFDFYPLLDINEWTLSKDNIKYNCERVMYMIEIAKMIAQSINELEI